MNKWLNEYYYIYIIKVVNWIKSFKNFNLIK